MIRGMSILSEVVCTLVCLISAVDSMLLNAVYFVLLSKCFLVQRLDAVISMVFYLFIYFNINYIYNLPQLDKPSPEVSINLGLCRLDGSGIESLKSRKGTLSLICLLLVWTRYLMGSYFIKV